MRATDLNSPPLRSPGWLSSIPLLIALLITIGLVLTAYGVFFLGFMLGILGSLMWVYGVTNHPADPPTIGLLTIWDRPVQGPNTVNGKVFLANYFPFYLNSIAIEMILRHEDYPVQNVLSSDRVAMSGEISLTVKPDESRLIDYVAAGKMDGVVQMIRNHVAVQTAKFCADKSWQNIQQTSADYEQHLKNEIETMPFGVKVEKLRVRLSAPPSILRDAAAEARELLQRRGELTEYQTYLIAAQERLEAIKNDAKPGDPIPTLQEVIEKIKHERLIRDGKVVRVEGNASNLIVTDSGLNFRR